MSSIATGKLIKTLRTNLGLTIQNVADVLGVSKASVCKWESGECIKTENLFDLAKLLGVSYSELYDGKLIKESKTEKRDYFSSYFAIFVQKYRKIPH